MADYKDRVNQHYGCDNLGDQLLFALQSAGKKIHQLDREALSVFDELHIGGIVETRNLARLIPNLQSNMRVLDVGSGLGGPARTLAAEFGCYVVGLDMTSVFCQIAEVLTEAVQLTSHVTFWEGNALEMPFEDNSFDVVWLQCSGMNIANKTELYQQCWRVTREGGYLAFQEVMAGSSADLHFPVYWAEDDTLNFLESPERIQILLTSIGYDALAWHDTSQQTIDWLKQGQVAQAETNILALHVSSLTVSNAAQKAANVIRNLEENRATVIQAVYKVLNKRDQVVK